MSASQGSASRDGLLRCSHGLFEGLPNEPRIRDTARFGAGLHGREQRLWHAHVDLLVLFLELKLCRFELREIEPDRSWARKASACLSVFSRGTLFFLMSDILLCVHESRCHGPDETAVVFDRIVLNARTSPLRLSRSSAPGATTARQVVMHAASAYLTYFGGSPFPQGSYCDANSTRSLIEGWL